MRKTGIDLNELPERIRRQAQKKYYSEIRREVREDVLVLGKETCISEDEGAEQETLFSWAALNSGAHPELSKMHHIPNGGNRNSGEAAKLKRQGVLKGVPDIFLPCARGAYHGLYIELKAKGGKVSPEQEEFLRGVYAEGFMAAVCYGADAAIRLIEKYLRGEA